jgi:hypothetical protein
MSWRVLAPLMLAAVLGCSKSTAPKPQPVSTSPGNSTPELSVRSVVWSWNQKNVETYQTLFAQDYHFAFSTLDPAGDAYRGDLWNRDDEMLFAQHLFVGGSPIEPPATSISLSLGTNLTAEPDPRPGRDPRWHKQIATVLTLIVTDPDRQMNINGPATFYFVRGDSAHVPAGALRDSTRWYIDRWEDDTSENPGGIAQAMPVKNFTLGQLKVLYLAPVAASRRPML